MSEQEYPKATPSWGWIVLLPLYSGLIIVLSLVGGSFILPTAAWTDGLIWGGSTTIGFFIVLRFCRVQSDLIFILSILLFVLTFIGSQIAYYEDRVSSLQLELQAPDIDLPQQWKKLEANAAYQAQMRQILNKQNAGGWLDHLKTQASIGVVRYERQPRISRQLVERQGWQMWFGWISIYFFLAIGCFLGIGGGVPETKDDKNKSTIEGAASIPLSCPPIEKSVNRNRDIKILSLTKTNKQRIAPENIAKYFTDVNDKLVLELTQDLVFLKQWRELNKNTPVLDDGRLKKISRLHQLYYNAIQSTELIEPYHFLLLVADRLSNKAGNEFDYGAHQQAWKLFNEFGLGTDIPPLNSLDLEGINFKKLTLGTKWQDLRTTNFVCYEKGSSWEQINNTETEQIPEAAYLGVLNQAACTNPKDKRSYEGEGSGMNWPSNVIDNLGPAMRDAILYFISDDSVPVKPLSINTKQLLLSRFAQWEYEIGAPILERCVKAGWIKTIERLPESERWKIFLDNLHPSPFGYPNTPWYIGHLRRQGKY